ncbi:MAG: FHA domain-containing protein [Lachnospiraceae bacterium]|nr:FHA domain-containing protein [Lachnospiraceae bacterium]
MELQWEDGRQELSYLIDEKEGERSVALKMMEHNQIEGLLPIHRQYIDEQIQLIYEVYGYHSLQEILEKQTVSVSRACRFLRQILDVLLESETFFLNMQEYCFDPKFIYLDRNKQQIYLCYMPGSNQDPHSGMRSLFEIVMEHLDHRNKQEIEWFYGLYDMHCAEEITFVELREHLERCSRNTGQDLQECGNIRTEKEISKRKDGSDTKKQLLEDTGSFCLKRCEQRKLWKKKVGMASVLPEQFVLCEGRYAVGRRQDQKMQLLPQQISREHALLEVEQGQIYLTDQGSANGTYINDRKISAHVKTRLKVGDVITFADISYQLSHKI